MFNQVFKENVHGLKHPGNCTSTEPELLSYRRPKRVVQNENDGYKNPLNSHKYHDENLDEINPIKEIVKWTHHDTQHQNSQSSAIDCDGVQLTNAQWHIVPISISWCRESWTIQLKCTFETQQERINLSYHATHKHDQTNLFSQKALMFIN